MPTFLSLNKWNQHNVADEVYLNVREIVRMEPADNGRGTVVFMGKAGAVHVKESIDQIQRAKRVDLT